MSSANEQNIDLAEALSAAGRVLGTAEVLFHQAVAEHAGLGATDHKYLDLLLREGPMPAGQLGELTGLTSGAVTGVIDRLEGQGLVRRAKDPADRRKVIIEPLTEEALHRLGPIFEPMGRAMDALNARYSDEELTLILDYMNRCASLLHEQTRQLREAPREMTSS